jgi:hypothetical protein
MGGFSGDGSGNSGIKHALVSDTNVTNSECSVSCWVYSQDNFFYVVTNMTGADVIASIGTDGIDTGFSVLGDITQAISFTWPNLERRGGWSQMLATKIGGTGYVYVNGTLRGSRTHGNAALTGQWTWGYHDTGSSALVGTICDTRIYNRGFTPTEALDFWRNPLDLYTLGYNRRRYSKARFRLNMT